MAFTPKQQNWKWFENDGIEPEQPLTSENVRPTLSNNFDKIRLRISIAETGNISNNNGLVSLEYSTDLTNWFLLSDVANVWNFADGLATEGDEIVDFKTTDANTKGEFCESASNKVKFPALKIVENDICLVPNENIQFASVYYFRILIDGTPVPLNSGETYPQLKTSPMGIITLRETKRWLEIGELSMEFDVLLYDLILDVIAEAESYMDLKITEVHSFETYLDGGGRSFLTTPHLNISNVTIQQDINRAFGDDTIVSSSSYRIDCPRGKIRRIDGAKWLDAIDGIKIWYDGGYNSESIPNDLKRALIKQIGYAFRRRKDPGLSSVTFPDGSISKFVTDEWLPEVEVVLNRYGRIFL